MKYKMVMGYKIPDTGKWWTLKMVAAGIIAGLFSTIIAYVFYKKTVPDFPVAKFAMKYSLIGTGIHLFLFCLLPMLSTLVPYL